MVRRLERDGFIERAEDKTLNFTESGRSTRSQSSAATAWWSAS
jgi:Mn-dependent DtxR family transcriptional regulator